MIEKRSQSDQKRKATKQDVDEVELQIARLAAQQGMASEEEKQLLEKEARADEPDDLDDLAKFFTPTNNGDHSEA